MPLPFSKTGAGEPPLVLLHGFGGSRAAWDRVLARLDGRRRTLAFDLPGHGASLDHPHGSAAKAARSIIEAMSEHGITGAHLAGHSMGGAAASLIALMQPPLVASLTLLSPGGFGPEADQVALRRHASAREADAIEEALEPFFKAGSPHRKQLALEQAKQRMAPGATDALQGIVETFFDGERQKMLPLGALAGLKIPIGVLWGSADRILPATQARALGDAAAIRVALGAGHMLPHDAPDETAQLIRETMARAG